MLCLSHDLRDCVACKRVVSDCESDVHVTVHRDKFL